MNTKSFLMITIMIIMCVLFGCGKQVPYQEQEIIITPFYETTDRFNSDLSVQDVVEILENDGFEVYQSSPDVLLSESEWYGVTGAMIFCFDDESKLEFVAWGDKDYGDFKERGIDDDFYTTLKAALTIKYGQIQSMDMKDTVCWRDGQIVMRADDEGFSITSFRRDKLCEF